MSRYTTGTKVPFLKVEFTMETSGVAGTGPWKPLPGRDNITAVSVHLLGCNSEHDVAWEYRPEVKDGKGYVFIAEDDQVWYNQYPTYSASQTSDAMNYVIHPAVIGDDDFYFYHDALKYLDGLWDAMHPRKPGQGVPEEFVPAFQKHYNDVKEALEKALGQPVVKKPFTMRRTDGTVQEFPHMQVHEYANEIPHQVKVTQEMQEAFLAEHQS